MTRRLIMDTVELISHKSLDKEGLSALEDLVGIHRSDILCAALLWVLYRKGGPLCRLDTYRELGETGRSAKTGPIIEKWVTKNAAELAEAFSPLLEHEGLILDYVTFDSIFVMCSLKPEPITYPPIVIIRNSMSVNDMTVRARNAIKGSINLAVPWYLSASFAYYKEDVSLMTDTYYDDICILLNERWDDITHRHKSLIERDALSAGTGYNLKYDKWPLILQSATRQLMSELNTL
jgi:hypothetical protein